MNCNQLFISGLDSSQRRFFAKGIELVYRWDRCLSKFGRYVEKETVTFDI